MVAAADVVARKSATDGDEPVQAEARKGFFVRFMDALRETRSRQARREIAKTLIYYHTILGPDRSPKEGICTGGPHANNTRHCGGLRWHLSQCDGITEQYGYAHRDGRDEQPNL